MSKPDSGMTLIELLAAILIAGLLSAISIPAYLNQVAKGKEAEAKQYIGAINRSQQIFYLQKNIFAQSIGDLAIGIPEADKWYQYRILVKGSLAIAASFPVNTNSLRAYTGGVQAIITEDAQAITPSVLCQSEKPREGDFDGVRSGEGGNGPECIDGFIDLNR